MYCSICQNSNLKTIRSCTRSSEGIRHAKDTDLVTRHDRLRDGSTLPSTAGLFDVTRPRAVPICPH